jgi:dienelactone hydrolase
MLERGFAALAIDGPQGLKIPADNFGDAGKPCVAWIDSRRDLDPERIGVFGRSRGGQMTALLWALAW